MTTYEQPPPNTKKRGFTVDIFPLWELEKRDREVQARGAVVVESEEGLWKPNDPRWLMKPPFGFVPFTVRFGGRCVYCGVRIVQGARALYSKKIQSIAHEECHANFDREVPRVEPSP